MIDRYFQLGKIGLGLKQAERIFDGSLHCAEIPHMTHARVLLPLLKNEQPETAMQHHRAGYSMAKDNPEFANFIAMHIAFLALTGNDSRALRLLQRHANDFVETADPFREFESLRYAMLAVDVISARKQHARSPAESIGCLRGRRRLSVSDLAAELRTARDFAGRFDSRNGNDHYTTCQNTAA